MIIYSEFEETKFKEFNDAHRSQYDANEFDACPSSLEAAKKRNLKIIEVCLSFVTATGHKS